MRYCFLFALSYLFVRLFSFVLFWLVQRDDLQSFHLQRSVLIVFFDMMMVCLIRWDLVQNIWIFSVFKWCMSVIPISRFVFFNFNNHFSNLHRSLLLCFCRDTIFANPFRFLFVDKFDQKAFCELCLPWKWNIWILQYFGAGDLCMWKRMCCYWSLFIDEINVCALLARKSFYAAPNAENFQKIFPGVSKYD